MREEVAVIVGAGQSGLATAACLTALSVPCLILERDDCIASLWRKRCYDRVTLHLAKQFSELPHAPHPPEAPAYLPKWDYIRYLEDYAARFRLRVGLRREVESAEYDQAAGRWRVAARIIKDGEEDGGGGDVEEYTARYLVVASGENAEMVVPEIPGLEGFGGTVVHSSLYRTGSEYAGKAALVVGCGNSGMEVAFDLAESGARTGIVVRRQFGDLSKYGLHRPSKGPMYVKKNTSTYPIVDVGTVNKIKSGEIQVLPSVKCIKGKYVTFSDGRFQHFDAIILATGYRSTVKKWLKGDDYLIGEDGMTKQKMPNHWKGKNRLYCAGLSRFGIPGSAQDAKNIADDIARDYKCQK